MFTLNNNLNSEIQIYNVKQGLNHFYSLYIISCLNFTKFTKKNHTYLYFRTRQFIGTRWSISKSFKIVTTCYSSFALTSKFLFHRWRRRYRWRNRKWSGLCYRKYRGYNRNYCGQKETWIVFVGQIISFWGFKQKLWFWQFI